jgi:hypothetical protein
MLPCSFRAYFRYRDWSDLEFSGYAYVAIAFGEQALDLFGVSLVDLGSAVCASNPRLRDAQAIIVCHVILWRVPPKIVDPIILLVSVPVASFHSWGAWSDKLFENDIVNEFQD